MGQKTSQLASYLTIGCLSGSIVANLASICLNNEAIRYNTDAFNLWKQELLNNPSARVTNAAVESTVGIHSTAYWAQKLGVDSPAIINDLDWNKGAACAKELVGYVSSVPTSEWQVNASVSYDWDTVQSVTIRGCEFQWRTGDVRPSSELRNGGVFKMDVIYFMPHSGVRFEFVHDAAGDVIRVLEDGVLKQRTTNPS